MKTKLSAFILFLGIVSSINAQVGINTVDPKTTLDVVADTDSTSSADGVLLPRLTVAQLKSKDNAYTTDQNGDLVFVTDGATGGSGKTVDVTAKGFYYYDAPNSKWVAVSATASAKSLNIGSTVHTTDYTITESDDFIRLNVPEGKTLTLTFPTDVEVGKKYYISNVGNGTVTLSPIPIEGGTVSNMGGTQAAVFLYIGNGQYSRISGY